MIGYVTTLYISKEAGDRINGILDALRDRGVEMKNATFFRNAGILYAQALEMYLENMDKFSDVIDFSVWLSEVIVELRKKIKQLSKEEFKKLREGKIPEIILPGEKNVGENRLGKELEDIIKKLRGDSK